MTELLDAFESLISQPEISPHTFCHQLQSLYHLSTALPLLSIYSTAYFQHSLCHLSTALPLQHSLYHHFYSTAYTAQPLPYVYSTAYTAQPLPSFPQPLQPPISARLTSVSAHTSMRETSPVLPSTCICNVHTPVTWMPAASPPSSSSSSSAPSCSVRIAPSKASLMTGAAWDGEK